MPENISYSDEKIALAIKVADEHRYCFSNCYVHGKRWSDEDEAHHKKYNELFELCPDFRKVIQDTHYTKLWATRKNSESPISVSYANSNGSVKLPAYVYEVEIFICGDWVKEKRYYSKQISIEDNSICDIEGVRRNGKFIGVMNHEVRKKGDVVTPKKKKRRVTYVLSTPLRAKRKRVYENDGWKCTNCGETDITKLSLDHIHPKSKGGKGHVANLQTLCKRCNSLKGDRIIPRGRKITPLTEEEKELLKQCLTPK